MDYTIKYNGKTNLDFDMYWDAGTDFELGTPIANVDETDVPGVNGTLLDFNGSYKSFQQKFTFYAVHKDMSATKLKSRLTEWLLKDPNYHQMVFSKDPDYYYEAAPNASSVLKFPAYNQHYSKVEITFLVKPFKYRLDGQNEVSIPKGSTINLTNPENWISYPFIHIKGTEGVTIAINGKEYKLTDIDGEIFIDGQPENSIVYHDLGNQGMRNRVAIFPDHHFPILDPGNNVILITGNYESATLVPRWRAIC